MLDLEQGARLVKLARNAVSSVFTQELEGEIDLSAHKDEFREKQGVFVTLEAEGELRGCIGFPEPMFPLYKGIVRAARSAAFQDPRFPPITKDELDMITFEVSVLSVPERINAEKPEDYIESIEIGRHGLIIRSPYSSGLLLPQVATEHNLDAERFLEHTCMKAGMEKDCWKNPENEVYSFEAQIFSEKEPNGDIIEKEL